MRGLLASAVLVAALFPCTLARAAEPEAPDQLPEPQRVPLVTPLPVPFPVYPRTNPYDVWQYYGVDREGYFRPRVIYAPTGSYYSYNGEPYPFTPMHLRDFMPYSVGW